MTGYTIIGSDGITSFPVIEGRKYMFVANGWAGGTFTAKFGDVKNEGPYAIPEFPASPGSEFCFSFIAATPFVTITAESVATAASIKLLLLPLGV